MYRLKIIWVCAVLLLSGLVLIQAEPVSQQLATETPAQIDLAPDAQEQSKEATPTRTPTPEGGALLEAKEFANVRAEPSTESSQLGTIRAGETYRVLGRYISWIQFEFSSSPTGRGWVYGELVNLTGNIESIPEIDPFSPAAQLDIAARGATATQDILTQTPGGVLTATVIARQITLPSAATATDSGTRAILPTFTFPPGLIAAVPTTAPESDGAAENQPPAPAASNDVPPIVPILVLGGVGLLGLAVSALRRG